MTSDYYKVDDDREPFTDTIPRGLSAGVSEVRFKLEHIVSEETVVNAAASVTSSTSDSSTVEYTWSDGDLNRAGLHEAEWRVVYTDGDVETFPKDDRDNPQIDVSPTIDSGPVVTPPLDRVGPHDLYLATPLSQAPDAPATGEAGIYVDANYNIVVIDEDGVTYTGGGGGGGGSYTDEDAQDAVGTITDGTLVYDDAGPSLGVADGSLGTAKLSFDTATQSELNAHTADTDAHHTRYADADAIAAINNDPDHGSTASHNYRTDEEIEDTVNALLAAGTNVSITYDDGTDTLTISATDTDTQLTNEAVEDIVGALITAGNAAAVTYDDAGNSLSVGVDESAIDLSNLTGTLSAGQLADGAVSEAKLNVTDTPASGEVLKYNGSQLEWQPDDTGSGGSAIVLDLGDDGTNESSDLAEVATTNDANNIVTEPAADKALIDMGQPWPGGVDDDAITEPKVAATDTPNSGERLSYNGTSLEWVGGASTVQEVTKSGDGSTTTFTLSHGFGTTAVDVSPTSPAASTDFWITNRTTSSVEITYAAAPPSGTNNLVYDLLTPDASATTILSDSGSDTDGGDDYVLPQAADNIDLQSDGEILNGQRVNSAEYRVGGQTLAQSVAASGQSTLSSGTAVVDTTISATDATFTLALGVDDPNADAKITGRLFWDDSAGTYKIEIVEDGTSVGNPTVNYDVVRVR